MLFVNSQFFIDILVFLFLGSQGVVSANIKCPLKWVRLASGDARPQSVVPATSDDTQLIIRGQTSSDGANQYTIGRFESGKGYFPVSSNGVVQLDVFEVLTNPNGCITNWKTGNSGGLHQIPSHAGSTKYVGRAISLRFGIPISISFISGQVQGAQITFADTSSASKTSTSFQVLESFSYGLTLKLANFIFDDDAFMPTNEFVGIDMIFNRGDSEIKQTIIQKKTVLQRTTTTSSSSWENAFEVGMSMDADLNLTGENSTIKAVAMPHMEFSYQRNDKWENSNELVQEKEVVIEVTREVIVPPFTSVQVCSTVTLCNDFNAKYTARAEYTAPGLTGAEVKAYVSGAARIEGNAVIIDQYEGTLQGNMALNTKFYVSEMDNAFGCSGMSKAIADLKRDMAFQRISKSEYSQRNAKINSMIHKWK